MTKRELLDMLSEYPDDTPLFDGKGYDLRKTSVSEMKYDDWANSTKEDDGYETPVVGIGISIGPRF